MTKVWKILMRFLDSPPWADRSKGLEFTGILLTSFVNIDNKWANCSYDLLNDKSLKIWKFWWDFLTHLELTALRGLNSPASFWFLSFSFVNIDNKWANCSKWDIFFSENSLKTIWRDFLTPWADCSKASLNFTSILLISFFLSFFIDLHLVFEQDYSDK